MSSVVESGETKKWDVAGISLSILCAIHCLSVPFLVGVLPLLGLDFMADHGFEWVMMALIFSVAAISYYSGYRRHRHKAIFAFLFIGILVFALVRPFLPEDLHSIATLAGGTVFILGHWKNWHWHRPSCHEPCCS